MSANALILHVVHPYNDFTVMHVLETDAITVTLYMYWLRHWLWSGRHRYKRVISSRRTYTLVLA